MDQSDHGNRLLLRAVQEFAATNDQIVSLCLSELDSALHMLDLANGTAEIATRSRARQLAQVKYYKVLAALPWSRHEWQAGRVIECEARLSA